MALKKITYIGPYSGITCHDIDVTNQPRGEAFEAPESWVLKKITTEPQNWTIEGDAPKAKAKSKTKAKSRSVLAD